MKITEKEQQFLDDVGIAEDECFVSPVRDGFFHWSGFFLSRDEMEYLQPREIKSAIRQYLSDISEIDQKQMRARFNAYREACVWLRNFHTWLGEKVEKNKFPWGLKMNDAVEEYRRRMSLYLKEFQPFSLLQDEHLTDAVPEKIRLRTQEALRIYEENCRYYR